ncbi:MAG TPA: response regulator transcription factor [Vicinamibacterales bacterium]|nr:response regulator transcription factor [Vicinamibacterales bacterium]
MVNAPVGVAVIEDLREVREGLAVLINATAGFRCVGRYRSMEEALAALIAPPDLILVDIGLPGMNGIEGTKRLRARFADVPILALTVHDDDGNVFDALCAGASGYLLKNTPPARLVDSLREAIAGGAPMSPEVARRVLAIFRTFRPPPRATCHLTPQETTLLKLMIEGHHYKTAARELNISPNTVSFHLKNVYEKLQVHSKSEAVAKAIKEGIV